jgi:hypothetical protein
MSNFQTRQSESINFEYHDLKTVYSILREAGYAFALFEEHATEGKVFLRHDIDCSLVRALEMARFENALGLISTYFIQPDNDFYNLLSPHSLQHIIAIHKLGHSLGLHISASNCTSTEGLAEYIDRTFNFFLNCFPLARIFSFHRPGSFDGWQTIDIPGYINTYHAKYFQDIHYFSDSNRRNFITSDFFAATTTGKSIQLLTHPIWWSLNGCTAQDVAKNFIAEKTKEITTGLGKNIKLFSNSRDKDYCR